VYQSAIIRALSSVADLVCSTSRSRIRFGWDTFAAFSCSAKLK
jgi:hypothetical protein